MDTDGKGSAVDHVVQAAEQMGEDPEQLLEKTFGAMTPPTGMDWVWDFFMMLNSARQHSGSGPLPIPFAEMESWSRLTGITIEVWEVQALRNLDLVWLNWKADHHGRRSKPRS